ncbi:integrase [Escherichia albertii]|uniref:tyrosine-type DNA invertase n=1 Tax=Escherichia albertii TaxID=208962 RepID=UPI0002BBC646|nr:tyrosine-type DNA invertase [Escherichia albertii]EFX6075922.1 integrase [Shigella boydii]AUS66858.1 integrase [Escherichia albertii]EAB1452167.1 integrase [Escherichia albertii]EEW0111861.1 integrase [Escherichia albertii]EEW7339271.1 integrase [Escherichia albertii]
MTQRKYLTQTEVELILREARKGKFGERNYCLLYLSFIHGFRVSEVCGLRLTDISLADKSVNINRMKNGFSTIHPLLPEGIRSLRKWLRKRQGMSGAVSEWLFISRQGGALSRQRVWQLIKKLGEQASIPIGSHPHMLRHACGYALADQGVDTRLIQDYLGHRNIRHTVRYTASNAERFRNVWERNKKFNK